MPHTMKKIFPFIVVACATLFLNSCLTSDYQSTPRISAYPLYRTSAEGVQDSLNYGDTIHVGDTIRTLMVLQGMFNELVYCRIKGDASAFDYCVEADSAYAHLLADDCRMNEVYLHFVAGCYMYPATFRYVAKKAGTYRFEIELGSTANEKYSPLSAYFVQEVR